MLWDDEILRTYQVTYLFVFLRQTFVWSVSEAIVPYLSANKSVRLIRKTNIQ